jgi:lysophospholipase L1-like esterase
MSKIEVRDEIGTKGLKYGRWKNIKLNKYGFNDSDDYNKYKKNHLVRIMCLGDSITFGTFTSPINWPNLLEKKLKSRNLDVEVINASTPGNTYTQLITRFESEYIEFKPDILLIYKGFRHYMVKNQNHSPVENGLNRMFRRSFFLRKYLDKLPADPYKRILKQRKRMGIDRLVTDITEKEVEFYTKDLFHLVELCKTKSIDLVLAPFPHLANMYNRNEYLDEIYQALFYYPQLSIEAYLKGLSMFNAVTKNFAIENNILYVNINKGLDCSTVYFMDNYHLTAKGANIVAENYANALAPFIIKKYLKYCVRSHKNA